METYSYINKETLLSLFVLCVSIHHRLMNTIGEFNRKKEAPLCAIICNQLVLSSDSLADFTLKVFFFSAVSHGMCLARPSIDMLIFGRYFFLVFPSGENFAKLSQLCPVSQRLFRIVCLCSRNLENWAAYVTAIRLFSSVNSFE